ncbi:Bug family tripartite tricarboxylate transporter substrate binding protein [Pseudorhodoferax sp.]|uniref:Bug family tripartite tricarboxylate transporter substrate binding protein n=1 Tax=Pseudorhodoferax sp. TaxID=1993553 RepID=UPI0039E5CACF
MHRPSFPQRRSALALLLAAGCAPAALAQAPYPGKPITVVVPFPPGGQTDVIGRLIGDQLARRLGQPVIVENRPGVNGSLGSEQVARAAADGYTLVVTGPGTHAINQLVNPNVKYDARKDFTHVAMITRAGNVLLASPAFKGASVADVVAMSKARPKSINFALTGIGSSGHMSMELLKQAAGIDFNAVPYKGDAPAITDLIGGQVDLLFVNATAAGAQVRGGKLRGLAVTSPERNDLLPELPTMAEAGQPGVVAQSWTGLAGPAGLPAAVAERLNREVQHILALPEVRERFAATGNTAVPGTPADAARFVADEVAKWSRVVQAGNIRAE